MFYEKYDYFFSSSPEPIYLTLTQENEEIRLTGIKELVENAFETDSVVLESTDEDYYFISIAKHKELRVLKLYKPSDNAANYNLEHDSNNRILSYSDKPIDETINYDNMYWLWDDDFDSESWKEYLNKELIAFVSSGNSVEKKEVRIKETNKFFDKLLRSQKAIKNKRLYEVQEKTDSEWITINKPQLIEIDFSSDNIVLRDRDKNKSRCYFVEV